MTKQSTLDIGLSRYGLSKLNGTAEPEYYDAPVLPGSQERGQGCGESIPHHCNDCGHTFILESSCLLRTCPSCWRKWAWKEARTASLRMWAGVSLIAPKRSNRRMLHAVISLVDNGRPVSHLRKQAIIIAKKHGLSGGLLIYHPFRHDGDSFCMDGYVHFHLVALARGDVQPGAQGDYVFKIIKDAIRHDYRGFQKWREVNACVFYLLTHCGILKGRHALTWYGELSYNQLSNGVLEARVPGLDLHPKYKQKCPHCHSFDIEPDWIIDYTDYANQYAIDNRLKAG